MARADVFATLIKKALRRCGFDVVRYEKPELNRWCHNAFQWTSIPDFLDYLRSIFPIMLAVEGDRYANLHDNDESYMVMYRHILHSESP